tara:strand:- start:14 stop:877 length:864 start_codon:yes stop_codon:yes gene_type:complete
VVNSFFKFKVKSAKPSLPSYLDIERSKKILFSIFTRYGDTIISIVVIKEFIKKFPNKKYLILCSRQMEPYVKELLPRLECVSLDKRNLLDVIKLNSTLKKRKIDIGFNPWSFGYESSYFLTYCQNFFFYKDYKKSKQVNHYEVVRQYLYLEPKKWLISDLVTGSNYKKILICPHSTDSSRSIPNIKIDNVVSNLLQKYPNSEITIASMDRADFRLTHNQFYFNKTAESSQNFIDLVKQSDLMVCADSGPLHIANALNKPLIAFFNTTKPEIVINSGDALNIQGALFS